MTEVNTKNKINVPITTFVFENENKIVKHLSNDVNISLVDSKEKAQMLIMPVQITIEPEELKKICDEYRYFPGIFCVWFTTYSTSDEYNDMVTDYLCMKGIDSVTCMESLYSVFERCGNLNEDDLLDNSGCDDDFEPEIVKVRGCEHWRKIMNEEDDVPINHQIIRNILSEIHPDMVINNESCAFVSDFLYSVFERILDKTETSDSKTITHDNVLTTAKEILSGELWNCASREMQISNVRIRKYHINVKNMKKEMSESGKTVTDTAACYMTSLLEYLASEILELAGKRLQKSIIVEDIVNAIEEDDELSKVFYYQ